MDTLRSVNGLRNMSRTQLETSLLPQPGGYEGWEVGGIEKEWQEVSLKR